MKNVITRLSRALGLSVVLALIATTLSLVFIAAPAQAQSDPTPVPVININVSAAEKAELKVDTTTTLLTDAEGRIILGPVSNPKNKGALHWLKKDGNRCPLVANQPTTDKQLSKIKPTTFVKKGSALKRFKKAVPSSKVVKKLKHGKRKLSVRCYRVKVGGSFTDTGEDAAGQPHGLLNHVTGSPMLFDVYIDTVKESDGDVVTKEVSRRRGQVGAGSNEFNVGDCLNIKANRVEFVPGQYVYVSSITKLRQRVQGMLNQRLRVAGKGRVEQGNCYVEFEYDFSTQGSLMFDQTIWAKTKAEAEGKAAMVATSIDVSTDVKGSIENSLKGQLMVAFGDQCNGGVTPEAVISLDELNDVDETDPNCEGTRDECESYLISTAHATVPEDVSGTLRISSNVGTVGFTPRRYLRRLARRRRFAASGPGSARPEVPLQRTDRGLQLHHHAHLHPRRGRSDRDGQQVGRHQRHPDDPAAQRGLTYTSGLAACQRSK
jgi:hypothetical protein